MEDFEILEGTKEDYIYLMLKYSHKHVYPIYVYNDMNDIKIIKCCWCKRINKTMLSDSYESYCGGNYFYCEYCKEHQEVSLRESEKIKYYEFMRKYFVTNNNIGFKKCSNIIKNISLNSNEMYGNKYNLSNTKYKYKAQ